MFNPYHHVLQHHLLDVELGLGSLEHVHRHEHRRLHLHDHGFDDERVLRSELGIYGREQREFLVSQQLGKGF